MSLSIIHFKLAISQRFRLFPRTDFDYSGSMKAVRVVLGLLAIIPIFLLADKLFFHPTEYDEDSLKNLVFLIFGVPILMFNIWAWVYPEIIEVYFFGKEKED